MTWLDDYRPASWRGVPFFVERAETERGRRLAVHEYPGRDTPYAEDLGRRTRSFTIDAFVLEPNHLNKAKALAGACEQPGAGKLVHPYLGEMDVVLLDSRESYSTQRGGTATFSLTFIEAWAPRYPAASADHTAAVESAANGLSDASQSAFADGFSLSGAISAITDDAQAVWDEATGAIADTLGPAIAEIEAAADFTRLIQRLNADAVLLGANPLLMAERLVGVAGATSAPGVSLNSWLVLADWEPTIPQIRGLSSSRVRANDNRRAITALVRRTGLAGGAQAAAAATYETFDDARAARDALGARFEIAESTSEIGTGDYTQLVNLRVAVTRAIAAQAPSLPRLATVTPATTRPVLVIAHDLYGDNVDAVVARALQIAARNALRHPGFALGGQALEVVSDA